MTNERRKCPSCGGNIYGPYACPCGIRPQPRLMNTPFLPITETDVRRIVREELAKIKGEMK